MQQIDVAVEALRDMPDQVTMHLLVAFNQYNEGDKEGALESLEYACEMYRMEVLD